MPTRWSVDRRRDGRRILRAVSTPDEIASFPIPWFQLQLARATQQLYYPEFLPDAQRPSGLPWSSASDRGDLSESFGTLRYGNLAEVLLYDVRRTMSLGGPNGSSSIRRSSVGCSTAPPPQTCGIWCTRPRIPSGGAPKNEANGTPTSWTVRWEP